MLGKGRQYITRVKVRKMSVVAKVLSSVTRRSNAIAVRDGPTVQRES